MAESTSLIIQTLSAVLRYKSRMSSKRQSHVRTLRRLAHPTSRLLRKSEKVPAGGQARQPPKEGVFRSAAQTR